MTCTTDANKQLIREHYEELVNRKNFAAADRQLTADFIDHGSPPGTPRGPEAAKLAMQRLHSALPDVWVTLDEVIAEGDRVAVRATWRGTHQGALFGRPPTGRKVTISGMVLWRVVDGRIAERWATVDLSCLSSGTCHGLSSVLETALYVDDLDAADRFYTELLGLTKILTVPGRQLVFRCGAGVLLIFNRERAEHEKVTINGGTIPFHGTRGSGHVAFSVGEPELRPWRERFHNAGIEIESEVNWPNGARSLYFRDPAGNCLELATPNMWDCPEILARQGAVSSN
jgi:predicted ester cyclase/catechol 2,3-dioxygenase-like lactoylglutathione lyase family enzyme